MADVVVSLVVVVAVVSISSTLLKLFMNADTPPLHLPYPLPFPFVIARPLTVKTPDSCQDGALQLFISLPEFRFTRSKGASF